MAKVKSTADKIKPRIDYSIFKSLGVLAFDFDNLYPNRCDDIANDSGTAKTCIGIFEKFVTGRGFANKDFAKAVVNRKGLTVAKLKRKIDNSIARHQGFAIHFNYNALGQKTEVNFIPFKNVRLGNPKDEGTKGKYLVYDDWDGKKNGSIKKEKIDIIEPYTLSGVMDQIEMCEGETLEEKFSSYNGQLYYWTPSGPNEYHEAIYDAVLEDMQTEAQIKRFRYSSSSRNFVASHVIVTGKEEVDDYESVDIGYANTEDAEARENPERDEDDYGSIAENMAQFQGGEGVGLVHIELESEDDIFKIEKVDLQDYDGLFEYTESSSKNAIREQYQIPTVLFMSQAKSSVASSNEITDAKIFYNDITEPWRDLEEEIFPEIFEGFVYEVNPEQDYTILPLKAEKPIPKEYTSYFDEDEIRQSLGHAPREKRE